MNWTGNVEPAPGLVKGYQVFYDPSHPLARGTGTVYLHRHVMAMKIGRWLTSKDLVHHRDGNKLNNHPDNLELTTRSGHATEHNFERRDNKPWPRCAGCGKEIHRWDAKHCSPECYALKRRRVERPARELLLEETEKLGFEAVGRKYGVSGNAIRKWLR